MLWLFLGQRLVEIGQLFSLSSGRTVAEFEFVGTEVVLSEQYCQSSILFVT